MKKLIAHGSGSIFQMCKAFRAGEKGPLHNPEFTMLEWYRIGWDHQQLAAEVADLLEYTLNCQPAICISYEQVFAKYLKINPHTADNATLATLAKKHNIYCSPQFSNTATKATWLDLLFCEIIEPHLVGPAPWIVHEYPISHKALAKVTLSPQANYQIAERFEVFYQGVELANGYNELCDPAEQELRFKEDLKQRNTLGKPEIPIDQDLLTALAHGLPQCAGVALGVDRILQLRTKKDHINQVLVLQN